jgi:diguanylate cyclase (GGDEF)-like protein/PAS domain S-box-containing protein
VLEAAGVSLVIWNLAYAQKEKERVERELRRGEERLRALVQHASDVIMVVEVDGSIAYASPALTRLLGYEEGTLERIGPDVIHPDHLDRVREFFQGVIDDPGEVSWIELPMRHRNGSYRWFEVGVSNRLEDPSVRGMVCNMRDVNERRAAEEQLTFQANHDALTRLPNRRLFLERLEQALFDAATHGRYVAVLFLDIDRFKIVNDSLGHEMGDRLLVAAAERLASCLRPSDVVARFGGDEFTVLLGGLHDAEAAITVADRITDRLRQPIVLGEHELFVSASVGIALSHGGQEHAGDLLKQADLAMYVAKEKGRSRWELFDPSSAPHVMERLELEGDLWRALEHGDLIVHFQPELDLVTGDVIAAEALVRWQHPRRGLLEPGAFIPFAEESSLIVAIDRFVLVQACRWARAWAPLRSNGEQLVVSVNLSPRFMRQADVVAEVTAVLHETGVDPRCVQLEITERTALTDLETTCIQLHQLRALGIRVAIDDFGTGYSSLSYLRRLPIDVLKLDRSFLDGIDAVDTDAAIVQAVITMGHALGMKVTAEGVERAPQAARLRELGCDSAMGWLWSKAVPPEDLRGLMQHGFHVLQGDAVVLPMRARSS